jgi:ribonuclease P protein component
MTANTHKISKLGVLKKRAEFLYVREGAYRAQGGIVIQMRANPTHEGLRVGFTATKKIGNAVIRNRAKRRLRELARALLPEHGLPGHDYVFIARDSTVGREWSALLDDTKKALITLCKRNGAKPRINADVKQKKKAD